MRQVARLFEFIRPYRFHYLAGICFLFLCDAGQLLIPGICKNLIESLETFSVTQGQVNRAALSIIALSAGVFVFRYLWRQNILVASRSIERDLRRRYFSHLLTLSPSWYDKAKVGDLMARATNDIRAVQMLVGIGFTAAFDGVVLCLASLLFMFALSPRLTFIVLVPLPVITVVVRVLGMRIYERFQKVQEAFSSLSDTVQENISGIRVVKDFSQEKMQIEKFSRVSRLYFDRNLDLVKITALIHPVIVFVIQLTFSMTLLFGGHAVIRGTLSLGALVAFLAYLDLLIWPMIAIGWVINLLQRGAASMGRICEILDTRSLITDGAGCCPSCDDAPAMELKNVTFSYGVSRDAALSGVSLTVPRGSTVALVGLTGSGKTTVGRLFTRQYDCVEGGVFVEGRPVNDFALSELRRKFAVVPQETFLFSGSIRNNIVMGVENADDARVEWAARRASILADIEAMPDGMRTLVGERGITLSGGQKQRIAIARALITERPCFIFDDCLSAVDTETEEEILAYFRSMGRWVTTLIVSNRISSVRHADIIYVLDRGRLSEVGTHSGLVAGCGVYADLYKRQLLEHWLETH